MLSYEALIAPRTRSGSIRDWINHDRIPVETILDEAQAFIYKHLRVREMRVSTSLSLIEDQSYVALPDGFISAIVMRSPLYGELDEYSDEYMMGQGRAYDSSSVLLTGKPTSFAIYNERFNFNLSPDADQAVELNYFKTPALLSATVETNFLTNKYPTMLRYAAMAYASDFLQDTAKFEAATRRAMSEIEGANIEEDTTRSHITTIARVP